LGKDLETRTPKRSTILTKNWH